MKNLNDHAGIDLDTLVSKNVSKKKRPSHDVKKVHFSLMIFVLRKSQLLKARRRKGLSQKADWHSPGVCPCALVLWVPMKAVVACPE